MPEGDTLAAAADRVGAVLTGRTLVDMDGTAREIRRERTRMRNRRVDDVTSVGKHLLVDFDNGWSLRTHLGMTGVWHVYETDEPWRKTPGKAKVVLTTAEHLAVCFAPRTVELAPAATVRSSIDHLGPDLMADEPDLVEIGRRAATATGPTAADLLLDQRVMAGIGNVYKSEILFMEGVHPDTPVTRLTPQLVERLARRGSRLLRANRSSIDRSTTGHRGRGGRLWVYGRAGKPCRRCGETIEAGNHGDLERVTYWCPSCQKATGDV